MRALGADVARALISHEPDNSSLKSLMTLKSLKTGRVRLFSAETAKIFSLLINFLTEEVTIRRWPAGIRSTTPVRALAEGPARHAGRLPGA